MRDISFRGKRVDDGEWVYGYVSQFGDIASIEFPVMTVGGENDGEIRFERHAVSRHTVGEYTGLRDKNFKKIYEGDIVHCKGMRWAIVHDEQHTGFAGRLICGDGFAGWLGRMDSEQTELYEIIGNIHDNPKFLEVYK